MLGADQAGQAHHRRRSRRGRCVDERPTRPPARQRQGEGRSLTAAITARQAVGAAASRGEISLAEVAGARTDAGAGVEACSTSTTTRTELVAVRRRPTLGAGPAMAHGVEVIGRDGRATPARFDVACDARGIIIGLLERPRLHLDREATAGAGSAHLRRAVPTAPAAGRGRRLGAHSGLAPSRGGGPGGPPAPRHRRGLPAPGSANVNCSPTRSPSGGRQRRARPDRRRPASSAAWSMTARPGAVDYEAAAGVCRTARLRRSAGRARRALRRQDGSDGRPLGVRYRAPGAWRRLPPPRRTAGPPPRPCTARSSGRRRA